MKTQEFTEYEQAILKHIKRGRNKDNFFTATITKVSSSGMSRRMKFLIVYKGKPLRITWLVAKLLNQKLLDDDSIRVGGCGMDMIFSTLMHVYSALGYKNTHNLTATNNYYYL